MKSNNRTEFLKFIILLIFVFLSFNIRTVNFEKAGITKLTFINKNSDGCDIIINFNLFDSRDSSTYLDTQYFTLSSHHELFFDVATFQHNFDNSIKEQLIDIDEDTEQLKKIFGCIKSIEVMNKGTRKKAQLYVYGATDGNLKVFILSSAFTNNIQFDCFHIDFNAALDSKSEYYHDCVNDVDKTYPNGCNSNLYKQALDPKIKPIDFIERMRFLYEQYFLTEPNLDNAQFLLNDSISRSRINKTLFQIWIGPEPMPEEYKKNQVKWQSILSNGWSYKLYTDKDVKELEFSDQESKKTYYSLPNVIAQSDLLRMEILNKYGGVYVDLDTEPFEPLDFLVMNFDFFAMLYGPNRGSLFVDTYFLGSIAGHPLIKQVIKNIVSLASDRSSLNHLEHPNKISPNLLTSIIPLTRAVYQHAGRYRTRDIILPVKYFNNYSTTIFSYGTHYPKRSWKK